MIKLSSVILADNRPEFFDYKSIKLIENVLYITEISVIKKSRTKITKMHIFKLDEDAIKVVIMSIEHMRYIAIF